MLVFNTFDKEKSWLKTFFFLGSIPTIFLQVAQASYNNNEKPDQSAVLGSWSHRGSNLLPLAQRSKQMVFSPLLLSVLRLGSCQWNWVVADATAAPRLVPDGTSQAPNPMKIHQI